MSTAVKVGAGDAKPIAGWLRRKMRPDTSRAALISYADNLADAISRRETVLLDQLRGGPDTVMDVSNFRQSRGSDRLVGTISVCCRTSAPISGGRPHHDGCW